MLAVVTSNSGEALFEIGAGQELVYHFGDDGPQEAIARLVRIDRLVETPRQTLPQRRLLGPEGTLDLLHHADQCRLAVLCLIMSRFG